jgi:hypothetical protein
VSFLGSVVSWQCRFQAVLASGRCSIIVLYSVVEAHFVSASGSRKFNGYNISLATGIHRRIHGHLGTRLGVPSYPDLRESGFLDQLQIITNWIRPIGT